MDIVRIRYKKPYVLPKKSELCFDRSLLVLPFKTGFILILKIASYI